MINTNRSVDSSIAELNIEAIDARRAIKAGKVCLKCVRPEFVVQPDKA